jgi:hypothetical protein
MVVKLIVTCEREIMISFTLTMIYSSTVRSTYYHSIQYNKLQNHNNGGIQHGVDCRVGPSNVRGPVQTPYMAFFDFLRTGFIMMILTFVITPYKTRTKPRIVAPPTPYITYY